MSVIMDVQGFKSEGNKFIPKEIAILSENRGLVLLIKPLYPFYSLTKKERLQVAWIERNRGIFWNEGFIPFINFKFHILDFFLNKRVYTKGFEKMMWLKEILETNNVYNLEDFDCPRLETLHEKYSMSTEIQSCIYHNKICAYKNVFCLKKWCVENEFNIFNK